MAIRYREGRASPWQCYWNNPFTGKRESESFNTEEDAKKHDSLVKHRLRFERESFRKEDTEQVEGSCGLTLEACYLQYLKQKKFSKKSLQWQMDSMRTPLQKIGSKPINAVGFDDLVAIKSELEKQGVKPVTVRGRFSVLRTVLRWCMDNGFCEPIRFPKLPPARYEKFVPPTPEELSTIMHAASPHIVRVIVLGAQFGVRVGPSELLKLTWKDVDFSRKVLRVHGAMKNLDVPWREVPIREDNLYFFEEWKREDALNGVEYVVHYRGKPVASIKTAWRMTLARAGITRRIRPYDLRHAFATELLSENVDVGTVAELMGHSSPSMLWKHYQHIMNKQKTAAMQALPALEYVPNGMCPKKKNPTAAQ